ncbi:MAG: BamA/TamA family outer membrane protein [Ignavibacteria bacterium]|nr:BamA/TamA family outer membrane protein [Ignavibacteria bacterium]
MKIYCKYLLFLVMMFYAFIITDISYSQLIIIEEIEVAYTDTKSFDEDILISALGLNESDVYKSQVLGENIYKLQKFYFDNGYFDAEIDTNVRYDLLEEEAFIKIIVTENRRYRIDSLIFTGLDKVEGNTGRLMRKINRIKSKDHYNKSLIMQQTNEIIDLLQNNGYMNARLKQDSGTVVKKYEDFSEPLLTVIINFEGADSIFYFGKTNISITNNKYGVESGLLRKEIAYNEGNIYSKKIKLLSETNMSKFPIVQSARISPYEVNNGKVDFHAEIILNKKTEIGPYAASVVIDNIFYIGGGVQYINKYFDKSGKILTLSFDGLINSFDINRIEFSAAITQPHVFNTNSYLTDKVTVGLYNIEDSKNYYIGNITSYLQTFTDFTFYNNASVDLTEDLLRFTYDTATGPAITTFNSLLSTTFVHDNTNDVFSPSKGFFHSITVGSGGLLPKLIINTFEPNVYYSQYFKLFTSNNFYFNLSKKPGNTVFATKFLVGDIIQYGSGDRLIPLPSFYKFFSGGSSSVRGWGARDNGVLENTNDGGDFLLEGSLELRNKLFPGADNFTENISTAVFFDYGNVWAADNDFRLDQIALAVGFGVRYNLFVGPVRVDFGFKLYDPGTAGNKWLFNDFANIFKNRFVVHFGIGEAF